VVSIIAFTTPGVASHPEIIVRAPNDDLAGTAAPVPGGVGWAVGLPLEIGRNAVAAFSMDAVEK
jgi:hypothetical protein